MLTVYYCPGCGRAGYITRIGTVYCSYNLGSSFSNQSKCLHANGRPFKILSKEELESRNAKKQNI